MNGGFRGVLGSSFGLTFGHVRQLDAVAARFLAGLTVHGGLVDTAAALTYLDMDDTIRRTYGYAKQGSGYGYSGVKGLNALLATVSSADRAPVIVATRLRKGSANSARGAARLVADSLKTTTSCGVGGTVILRADSAYYGADVIAAARRGGARFSITARKDRAVTAAIRAQLIGLAARITRSARQTTLRATDELAVGQRIEGTGHRQHRTTHPDLTNTNAAPGPKN